VKAPALAQFSMGGIHVPRVKAKHCSRRSSDWSEAICKETFPDAQTKNNQKIDATLACMQQIARPVIIVARI
jgi:hypothetical protein